MKITQIVIELLTNCNFVCPYCRDTSGEKKALSLNEVKEIINCFKKFGVRKVQLDGGEPFLYKDITQLIEYITEQGLEAGIYTNASVITSEIAKSISKYSNIKLCVTIHPLNPEKQIQATINGIRNLTKAGIYPQLVYVINSISYMKLPNILNKIPAGCYTFLLNPIVQSGRAFDNGIKPLDTEQRKAFKDIVDKAKETFKNINFIDNVSVENENLMIEKIQMNQEEEFALHINTDGYVLPFFSADNSTAIGNINNLAELEKHLFAPETMTYLEHSKLAMKKRIQGTQESKQRKIGRDEIISLIHV
ncbi:MAG: radical SAM protein [Anaerocolumna sp.]